MPYKDRIAGVYQITNMINGNTYIGSSVHIKKRLSHHKSRLRYDVHVNPHLQHSWNKYGEDNFRFDILLTCDKWNTLLFEKMLLDGYKPIYNIAEHPGKPSLGRHPTKETRMAIGKAHLGHRHTEDSKQKMSEAKMGEKNPNYKKSPSEETRRKISEALKGHIVSPETRRKIGEGNKGKKVSKETRDKTSESVKRYYRNKQLGEKT